MSRTRVTGSLVATVLVAGLLALGASAAPAAAEPAPTTNASGSTAADAYPRSVRTKCVARLIKRNGRPIRNKRNRVYVVHQKIRVRFVIRENSTANPRTRVNTRKYRGKQFVRSGHERRRYRGQPAVWRFGAGMRPGRYRRTFTMMDGPNSRFRNCSTQIRYKVVRKNKARLVRRR